MRVLITGKNGQVGSSLVSLLEAQTEIIFLALDRNQLDITNAEKVNQVISDFKPAVVINAAAYTAVDNAEQESERAYAINCDGAKNLAVAANQVDAIIIHLSTDYVFSGDKEGAYIESDITAPQGVYGHSKLAGEQAVAAACPRHIVLRTAWVFGEHGNNFVKTMLRLAESRDELGVVADQFGGPTYAGDIASSLITIVKAIISNTNATYGIYHYSGVPYVSWHQLAEYIFDQATAQGLIKKTMRVNAIATADYPTPAKRPANSKLDCSKIMTNFSIALSDWQASLSNLSEYKS